MAKSQSRLGRSKLKKKDFLSLLMQRFRLGKARDSASVARASERFAANKAKDSGSVVRKSERKGFRE